MQCSDKNKFGVLGMMIFIGWMLASIVVPRIADIYGRKLVFVGNMLLQLVGLTLIIYAKSFSCILAGLFINGVCSAGRWTVTYVYLAEFLTEAKIKIYVGLMNSSAALAVPVGALTIQVITKNTIVLEYLAVSLTIFGGIAGFFFLPESPKWLVGHGSMEKARMAYAYIAKVNGKAEDVESEIGDWEFKQQ